MTAGQAVLSFDLYQEYEPSLAQAGRLQDRALLLSVERYLSYWDALYLCLAMEYRCDLVTADARFQRAAVKLYPYVELLRA
jgi:predicted nucleic acid-binding protein